MFVDYVHAEQGFSSKKAPQQNRADMLNVGFLVLMSKMPVREVTQDEFTQGLLKWASCVRWEFGLTLLRLEKVCYMELHVGL